LPEIRKLGERRFRYGQCCQCIHLFWGFLSNVMTFAGIIVIPATFYGVLECVKNAAQGKKPGEYKKAFIWTAIGLVLTLAPMITAVLVSINF